ncbi:MAG: peptidoglycan DD-metalloendopeptidase family protein [Bacteroidaceae bacterium]|nr:peptidoglycan DD-metalloendopeptidase family protein [Bacteroidaceae bacterium]
MICKVRNIFRYFLLLALFVAAIPCAQAQDKLVDEVSLQSQMEYVDTVEQHLMLLNEAYIIPSDHMYPEWVNSGVHYTAQLPDSFRIDLTGYVMPTTNTKITDIFGYRPRRRRMHKGLDIKVQRGDTIYAAFDGKVRITSFQRRGYGHYIVVRHNNGIETLYAHLSKRLVDENQNVKAGDPIGLGGNSGRSTGSHLHFETILMGKSIDPALLFDFKNQSVTGEYYVYRKPGSRYIENGVAKVAGPEPKFHKVKKGDTVAKIARKHGVSQSAIFKLNGLTSRSIIRPGQNLRVQ